MTFDPRKEAELVALAQAGDRAAFDRLAAPLREKIYWRAAKAVGDLDEAEDVTQETLVRAFTRLSTFRGDARFSSWLYQVGTNCIRMHLRTRRRRGASRIDDFTHEVEAQHDEARLMGHDPRPDSVAIQSELATALEDAISKLPPQYGSILRLWVEDGLDLKEIHERSGLSIAAIKSRLHRARRRVRDSIETEYGVGAILAA